jgi:predicted NBD/HSP70 family sugar kinase
VTRVEQLEPPRFDVREDRGLVIGISLSRQQVHGVVTNLRATTVLATRVVPLTSMVPDDVIDLIAEVVEELRSDDSLGKGDEIVGLGVALAGLVDGPTGEVIVAPDLETEEGPWRHVALESILQDRTGLATAVENDANALALHEYLLRGEEQNLAVVLISRSGEGVGGGLVINGSLAHGIGGISGELGHTVVDPKGPECRCAQGARGCLETYVSPSAILRQIEERSGSRPASLEEAAGLVARANQSATSVFRFAGGKLGKALADLISLVGPNRIVLYGPAELIDEAETSAKAFLREVRRGEANIAFAVKVDLITKVLSATSEPCAAAATAVHYFLEQPWRWVQSIASAAELSQVELV